MDIRQRLKEVFEEEFAEIDNPKDSLTLDELGLDSLDKVEFVMSIEDEFDINIPDNVWGSVKTWGDLVDYIEKAVG